MSSTLTIRLPLAQREALKRRAAVLKKTESALIRDLVDREIEHAPLATLVEKWAGTVDSRKTARAAHPLKKQIRERNWRA